jgi:Domain of unknown function (DUF4406)
VKIYLSGPMRGYACFNFPAFHAARTSLRDQGHTVVCPAERDLEQGFDPSRPIHEQDFDVDAALAFDIAALPHVDAIALLPGWQYSAGCAIELERAVELQLLILNLYVADDDMGGERVIPDISTTYPWQTAAWSA